MTARYLYEWPSVDLDVKQAFQFSGLQALQSYEIDLLVTPDPCHKDGLHFEPVFDYEQVLVVSNDHPLKSEAYVIPRQLGNEVLFTYPVSNNRLDIFTHFLNPSGISIRTQKVVETTEMMLQLVACGRGIAALPRWLVEENAEKYPIAAVRLGKNGLAKQIHLGIREDELRINYLKAFVQSATAFRDSEISGIQPDSKH
jgi:LysR family transcriptional regulator for metE and metH